MIEMIIKTIAIPVFGYLLGSISTAIIVSKLYCLPDPRTCGSSNPGATNVLRIGGKIPALLTLLGDVLKGVMAVILAKMLGLPAFGLAITMLAVFLGHLYPVFFRFQGGKGVATAIGVLLAFSWKLGILLIIIWLAVVLLSRFSSLGAIIAAIVAIYYSWFGFEPIYSVVITIIAGLLLIKHKLNIMRLLTGQEPKLTKS